MNVWPLVVVGAGPAGIGAATEAARLGIRPLLLDATGQPGGTIGIAHEVRNIPFLDDGVGGELVVHHLAGYLARWDVLVRPARVTRMACTAEGFVLETGAGEQWLASSVVLALGTVPLFPVIEGLAAEDPHLVGNAPAACEGGTPGRAAIIGGSDVAMDQARWLQSRGARVDVLARGQVRAPAWLVDAAIREGVTIRPRSQVTRAAVRDEQVALRVRCGGDASVLIVDRVVSAVGRKPVTIDGANDAIERHPDRIRVVGDGTGRRARHVVAALGDGCVAAADLLTRFA